MNLRYHFTHCTFKSSLKAETRSCPSLVKGVYSHIQPIFEMKYITQCVGFLQHTTEQENPMIKCVVVHENETYFFLRLYCSRQPTGMTKLTAPRKLAQYCLIVLSHCYYNQKQSVRVNHFLSFYCFSTSRLPGDFMPLTFPARICCARGIFTSRP